MISFNVGIMKKSNNFIIYNLSSVIFFGIVYYLLQLYDKNTFVYNHEIIVQKKTPNTFVNNHEILVQKNTPNTISLLECFHKSLMIQTTIDNGRMIPVSKLCIFVNILQIVSIIFITASAI